MGRNRCRDPQPKESGIGQREPEESRIPQEDLQSQLTWAHGVHRDQMPTTERVWTRARLPYTYVACMDLSFHVGPITIGTGEVSDLGSLATVWIPFP